MLFWIYLLGLISLSVLSESPPSKESKIFNLCGHIHPSFELKGKGKQKIKLPCFYITTKNIIFPSFGEFTGTHNIKLEKNSDEIILISKNELFHLDSQT